MGFTAGDVGWSLDLNESAEVKVVRDVEVPDGSQTARDVRPAAAKQRTPAMTQQKGERQKKEGIGRVK